MCLLLIISLLKILELEVIQEIEMEVMKLAPKKSGIIDTKISLEMNTQANE